MSHLKDVTEVRYSMGMLDTSKEVGLEANAEKT